MKIIVERFIIKRFTFLYFSFAESVGRGSPKYHKSTDSLAASPQSHFVLTPPLAHQKQLQSIRLSDHDDEPCLRPTHHLVSVIQHVPSYSVGHNDFPSSLDSPRIANAPINLSASAYRQRDIYPVSPTPASPFKPYEEINGNPHTVAGGRTGTPPSPYHASSGPPLYYETCRSPPGGERLFCNENNNYNLPIHYYRVSRPLKDEVSLSSNEDAGPPSPTKDDNCKPSSSVMPPLQLRVSILQQQVK